MILYLHYGTDSQSSIDSTIYETRTTTLDLIGSDISTIDFDPGFFDNPSQLYAQAVVKISMHGKPAYTHASKLISRFQVHVQTEVGRDLGLAAYLYYSPTDDQQLYRARIYSLSFQTTGDQAYFRAPNRNIEAVLVVTHGIWQGALTQLPLTNSHATNTLNPLQIENTFDSLGRDNTVLIRGSDVEGDLPAPIKLKITNTNILAVSQYWYSLNVNSAPTLFKHVYEGESATPLSNVVTADGSDGNSNSISVASTTDTTMLTWTLAGISMLQAAGNQFHVFISNHYSKTFSTNIYWRFTIKDAGGLSTLWKGEQVSFPNVGLDMGFGDYGVIRLPPFRVDRENYPPTGILLILSAAQITAAAAIQQYIDSIKLFPVDGFRNIVPNAFIQKDDYLIDDMIEGVSYQYFAGVGNLGAPALGNPILIHPNRDQKLYFLCNRYGGGSSNIVSLTNTVQIWYRPQRLII